MEGPDVAEFPFHSAVKLWPRKKRDVSFAIGDKLSHYGYSCTIRLANKSTKMTTATKTRPRPPKFLTPSAPTH